MASIDKRNDTYRIRVSCGYDASGKQIIKSMSWKPIEGMTEKQIEKELNKIAYEFEAKVTIGDYGDIVNIKLSDFCDRYLEMSDQTLAPTTKVFYTSVIESIIKPALGHMKLNAIKPIHAQQFIRLLSGSGVRSDGRGDTLSPATVKRYFTVFKSIMAKAYKLDLIDKNPTDTTKLDMPIIEEPEVEIFTQEEAIHMLSCLETEPLMFQVLIHLAIVTGCRRGELAALTWINIDLESATITVKRSNYKVPGEEIKSKSPKTKKSIRKIAIPPYLVDILREYRTEQLKERIRLGDKWINGDWLFTQWNGRPMNPQTPTRQFSRFLARHNIPHRKFHALRHTSATLLLLAGTNIKNVADRLGHTQLSTTNRYVHALRDADQEAAKTFEALVLTKEPEAKKA